LATARALKAEAPSCEVLFVGTDHGIEATVIPKTEFFVRFIKARGLRKTGLFAKIAGLFTLPAGMFGSLRIIYKFRPDFVLGVGGYASGPTTMTAALMGIPTGIQEQNSVMGSTNKLLMRFVDKVFTSWEHTAPAPPPEKTVQAGNPVRADVLAAHATTRNADEFHLLVFGGSQGAKSINEAVPRDLASWAAHTAGVKILHQTGRGAVEETRKAYERGGMNADVSEFIEDMGAALAWADLAVCRSGASSLAEITARGVPSILVPYPYAVGDHQMKNAKVVESAGAAFIVPNEDLESGALGALVQKCVNEPETLSRMAENSRKLGRPEAAQTIAREILAIIRGRS
jgi:UDP-N-acetylglucosamine--N-acetylmuramyl-(pentapeptide) pyrophosphoryl-undecaprenol N-acetylglucosamine transferase